ncbi:MAG: rlmN [Bacteroidota bacterium]|nr:rlmN [Bacteroidota bacterium]
MQKKTDIRTLSKEQLIEQLAQSGEKPFRAKQIYEWLWQKSAVDFDEMTNLSKELREKLKEHFVILPITAYKVQHSSDGTVKSAFQLHDKHLVEGVMIPTEDRATACVSSQVGCSLTCSFCATGFLKRERNLTAAEIYDQVVLLNKQANESTGKNLSNIVFMGMGEPLLNYNNVLSAIEKITSEEGLNMSAKRITVSTAGIAKMIKKLADDKVKFNLALSLHAPDDAKRNTIMPINEQNNIEALIEALQYFQEHCKGEITFEYILLNGVNDSLEDAKNLVALCKRIEDIKVNVIEYNKIENADFHKSNIATREAFIAYLEKNRVVANVRRSRGKDIDAACGQLANKN